MEEQAPKNEHSEPENPAILRALNAIAVGVMALVVGGVGAGLMADERLFWGLVLQVPFYALVMFCWGLSSRAPWAARFYLPGFAAGSVATVSIYLSSHAQTVAVQLGRWTGSIRQGLQLAAQSARGEGVTAGPGEWVGALVEHFSAEWLFGQPAVFWLIALFAAAPLAAWWRRRRDGETSRHLGDYLVHG